ncbi:MAG: hypothetical protein QXK89_05620 [Candidatus Bathyarchaeia archaeon]
MCPQNCPTLKKRVEGEFIEEDANINKLVETLIKSFLRTDSDYGAISDIKSDVNYIYRLVKNYISEEKLDIYALKLGNRILMSKTNIGFDEIYEVIKERSRLEAKKGIIEVWNDPESGIIHFLVLPLRKHFPIEYTTDNEKENIMNTLLEEYADI